MEIDVKKCGIQINPPSFIVIHKEGEKLKRKVMPLRNFKISSNVESVANDLQKRHNLGTIPLVKMEKLLRLLQELLRGEDKAEAMAKVEKEFNYKLSEDLNKLSLLEIEVQKQLMDSLFLKNQIKKDDENFEYDKRFDFAGEKEKSSWDLDSDNFWD